MKSIVIHEFGNPDVLQEQDAPIPIIHEDQVLVELYATSINPIDYYIRAGLTGDMFPIHFPHILGLDIAGVVKEVGARVKVFKKGDRVFGVGVSGSYAEYAISDESSLAIISPNISFVEAAALPVVAITAWQSLFQYGKLQPGERVLIHAGAGGVGHIAVQLAKNIGAYVITTASSSNFEFVKLLGADEVIDYTATDFSAAVKDMDLVLDSIGGEVQERSFKVIRAGGRLVSIISPTISELAKEFNIDAQVAFIQANRNDLERIERMVQGQKVKAHINHIYPLTKNGLLEAHTKRDRNHVNGKLVIEIRK